MARLVADGLVELHDGTPRTSARWKAAMMRAARTLFAAGDDGKDLRVPVAWALSGLYGAQLDDDTLAELVLAMLPIEQQELGSSVEMR